MLWAAGACRESLLSRLDLWLDPPKAFFFSLFMSWDIFPPHSLPLLTSQLTKKRTRSGEDFFKKKKKATRVADGTSLACLALLCLSAQRKEVYHWALPPAMIQYTVWIQCRWVMLGHHIKCSGSSLVLPQTHRFVHIWIKRKTGLRSIRMLFESYPSVEKTDSLCGFICSL